MKVIQTNKAYFPLIGGIETIVMNLSEGLQATGEVSLEVLVCSDKKTLRKKSQKINDIPVTYIPTLAKVASLPISPTYPLNLRKLKGDILHIHEPFPLADLTFLTSKKVQKNFSKVVVSWHSDIIRQQRSMKFYAPLIHKFLSKVDKIIVATPNHITSSSFLPEYKQKCMVIPYGIKLDYLIENKNTVSVDAIRVKYGTPLLLFVGRLVYYKGLEYLIKALKNLPTAKLIIIGSGPLEMDLRKQILDENLDERITILPHVSENELANYYNACDIFVLPSCEKSEQFGIVQVEAMACSKPIISTNIPTGVTYVNQDGVTGLTVKPFNSNSLSDAITHLIEDPELCKTFGNNGLERVTREFTIDVMVQRTLGLYKSLLS